MVAIPYAFFERLRLLVTGHHGEILDQDFGADVTLTARFMVDHFTGFQADLQELTAGTIQAEIIETHPDTIMPLGLIPPD
jgi:hypothetical protein